MDPMAKRVLFFVFVAWVIDAADSTIYSLTLPMIKDEFGLDLTTMGMIASVFLAGTVLGSLVLPILADRQGRRIGMASCVGMFSVATCLVGAAHNATMVALGRFFTGCGTGAEWPIGAAYLAEVVPAKRRGMAMGIMQAGYPVGFFLAGATFLVFTDWLGLGWRACYLFLVVPGVAICLPILLMLKESKTWLETRAAARAQGPAGSAPARGVGYGDLFGPRHGRSTAIATLLHIFGAVYSYGIVVWMPSALIIDFGYSKAGVSYFIMLSWAAGTVGYLLAGRLADHFGRRGVLVGYVALGLVAVLLLNLMKYTGWHDVVGLAVVGCMIGISVGVTVIYITYSSEIYPAQVRTVGLGFSVAIGKVVAVFVPTLLGAVAEVSSVSAALLVSTILGVLMIPAILFGPETAGRDLDQIAAAPEGRTEGRAAV
jgi:MFS family permease